jgi:hypothetical protein
VLDRGNFVIDLEGLLLAQPGSAEWSAIRSLPGDNRTFSTTRSTLQQCNTRQLNQFARLCSSFTTSASDSR